MLVLAVACAGYVPYQLYVTGHGAAAATEREQARLERDLESSWLASDPAEPSAAPEAAAEEDVDEPVSQADPLARLRIPKFGASWSYVVVSGVDRDAIRFGPGHDPRTELPGRVGNAVIAAHRDGYGSPFNDLESLSACDVIAVDMPEATYTYRVLPQAGPGRESQARACQSPETVTALTDGVYKDVQGVSVVAPDAVGVLDQVPGTNFAATMGLLTLYTCHPENSNKQRLVVHAALTGVERRT